MTIAMAATIKLHKTRQDNSKEHEGSKETRQYKISKGNKEMRLAEEKSAERERNEIAEMRGDKRGEGEQITCKVNEKRERASEEIKESRGKV